MAGMVAARKARFKRYIGPATGAGPCALLCSSLRIYPSSRRFYYSYKKNEFRYHHSSPPPSPTQEECTRKSIGKTQPAPIHPFDSQFTGTVRS
ncbi:hypothetical protein L873DRAFT_377920 [Choiromyces venosus 120613-1]|uniref:Uncharacterized protein n=1 Tax=Choiromyces venosus 120613-1 TaxID=1336337 RepID=A0A3N4J0T5_9PEZI|nr:hypothetical protein L873DRAFT_377920 [Choiromyces venosus 120613-1]